MMILRSVGVRLRRTCYLRKLLRQLVVGLIAATMVLFFAAPVTVALELDPSEIRGRSSKTPVNVLQNRYFLKSMRPEVGLIGGQFLNEAYTDTSKLGVRGGMFLSEWLGIEVQYIRTSIKDTDDRRALNELEYYPIGEDGDAVTSRVVRPDPETNPIAGVIDINAIVAPFYGKLNLFDRIIIYSDLYVTSGLAQVETSQGSKTALTLGAGQRFYLQQNFSLRVDVRDRIYDEQRAGRSTRKHALSVDFGASYFFN